MSLVVRCSIDSAAGLGAASGGDTIVAQGEAVRDNLDAPCIGYHIDVQVCGCCGRPSWADASNSVVEGQGASGQDARGGTRGAVVTELVKLPPTAASARCERDGEPQAAQQKDAKQRTGNGDVVPRWRDVENAGGEGPSLGQQQRTTGGCEVRKVHLVLALVASVGRESLPAFEGPTVAGGLFGGGDWVCGKQTNPGHRSRCQALEDRSGIAQGKTPSPRSALSRRSATVGAWAWTTGRVSHQEAQ